VPIVLQPGLPASIGGRLIPDEHAFAALLSPMRKRLQDVFFGTQEIASLAAELRTGEIEAQLLETKTSDLAAVRDLAAVLLDLAERFDLARWLLGVDEDVLGAYFHPEATLFDEPANVHIELYWAVIGLVAPMIDTTVEALTVVTLAHEVAHAYTHVGTDTDGKRWGARAFAESDAALREGLAQYYTHLACNGMERDAPGCRDAQEALLPRLPTRYHSHEPWLREFTGEQVRLALIETRLAGAGTIGSFENRLAKARERIPQGRSRSLAGTAR